MATQGVDGLEARDPHLAHHPTFLTTAFVPLVVTNLYVQTVVLQFFEYHYMDMEVNIYCLLICRLGPVLIARCYKHDQDT